MSLTRKKSGGATHRRTKFFLPILIGGLLLSVPGISSEVQEALFSRWQPSAGAAGQVAFFPGKIGSFSVRRPAAERLFGELADAGGQILSDALPGPEQFGVAAQETLRDALLFNRQSADFSDWLTGYRHRVGHSLSEASADYLDDYIAGIAESGAHRLRVVRHVEIEYQSPLGGRRGQVGIAALGALRETAADAVVWQLRGYLAEEDAAGANAGIIYRRAVNEALWGANIFADYERHGKADEDFLRGSFGVELRSAWLDVFANRYEAITGGKRQDDGDTVYTRSGYDIEARTHAPQRQWLSGGLTYYRWQGEYGDADDRGWRYHLALEPPSDNVFGGGWRVEIEMDSSAAGGSDWGGHLSYRRRFGAPAAANGEAGAAFDPRRFFFESVRREYSQRIESAAPGVTKELFWLSGFREYENTIFKYTDDGWVETGKRPDHFREFSAVYYDNALWLLGGRIGGSRTGDIWRYRLGVDDANGDGYLDEGEWQKLTLAAPFNPFVGSAAVPHDGRMLLIGGESQVSLGVVAGNRVWESSADGLRWQEHTAAWYPRSRPAVAAGGGTVWLMHGTLSPGASAPVTLSDVWRTTDGRDWREVNYRQPLSIYPSSSSAPVDKERRAVFFNGTLFIYGAGLTGEVWYSGNGGESWTKAANDLDWWQERRNYGLTEHDGLLYIAGGYYDDSAFQNLSDSWVSADGLNWTFAGSVTLDAFPPSNARRESHLLSAVPRSGRVP